MTDDSYPTASVTADSVGSQSSQGPRLEPLWAKMRPRKVKRETIKVELKPESGSALTADRVFH